MAPLTAIRVTARALAARIERLDTSAAQSSRAGSRLRFVVATGLGVASVAEIVRAFVEGGLPGPPVALTLMLAFALYVNKLGRFLRDWSPVLLILGIYILAYGLVSNLHQPVYYSPQAMPGALAAVSKWLPTAFAARGVQSALAGGAWAGAELLPLALTAFATLALGFRMMRWRED